MNDKNKTNIRFIVMLGALFIISSYFVIVLQIYYGLTGITCIELNTLLIIFGIVFSILIIKLLKLEKKLLENMNLLRLYLVAVVIIIFMFDWILQPIIVNYFKVINYLPLSFSMGFGGGILVSFFYLMSNKITKIANNEIINSD